MRAEVSAEVSAGEGVTRSRELPVRGLLSDERLLLCGDATCRSAVRSAIVAMCPASASAVPSSPQGKSKSGGVAFRIPDPQATSAIRNVGFSTDAEFISSLQIAALDPAC